MGGRTTPSYNHPWMQSFQLQRRAFMPVGTHGNKEPRRSGGGINHSVEALGTFPILTNFWFGD